MVSPSNRFGGQLQLGFSYPYIVYVPGCLSVKGRNRYREIAYRNFVIPQGFQSLCFDIVAFKLFR